MTIEEQVKNLIIQKFKSVRAFTQAINVPYSTIDSMLKKGIAGTGVQTVIKVCSALDIDIESLQTEQIKNPLTPNKSEAEELDENEQTLVHNYRELNDEGRERLLETSDDLVATGKYTKNNPAQVPKQA